MTEVRMLSSHVLYVCSPLIASNRNLGVNGGSNFLTILSVSNMELNNWFLFVMNVRIKIARDFGAKMNNDYDNGKSNGCLGCSTLGSVDGFRALVPTPLGDHVAVGVGHHPVPGPALVVHLAVLVAARCVA